MTWREKQTVPPLYFDEAGTRPEVLHRLLVEKEEQAMNDLQETCYLVAYALIASFIGLVAAATLVVWWLTL